MVSLAFVISFVVSAVVLLIGIVIYSDVSDSMIKTFGDPILISNGTGGGIVSANLYTCDNPPDGDKQIHLINKSTGQIISSQNVAVELVSGTYEGCVALATDPTDQQMYLVAKSSTALRYLVAIDPTTGLGTEVAEFTFSDTVTSYTPRTINFDITGQMYATVSDSEDTFGFLVKVNKATGVTDYIVNIDNKDFDGAYCEFLGYEGGDFGFTTLNYDTGKMFYIDGDSVIWYGTITSTPIIILNSTHSAFHDHADCTEGGFATETESDNFPHLPFLNFQMGMAYDTVTGDYFIQDSFEEPQSISRMSGSGVSSAVGTSITDGLQRGIAFALESGGGGSPVFESQIPESFAQANNVALTVLGVLPVALFFALFTILSGRVDGGE